ncbi:MAG: dTDP-4-dehydrorhamnose reductase [Paludibacteraceae bacterium]|nr:dTDP-4-dehydrorhamnose reductase [Paludibacteraceae bacterium]
MNILITGCLGQLGTEMRLQSEAHPMHTFFFTDIIASEGSDVLDITNREEVQSYVLAHQIDLIVNCAAYTNVDKAEEDEATAGKLNAFAVENLAATGAKMIHISTDYVFSGNENTPCRESDPVAPRTAYGRTKLEGERLLLQANPSAVIFRTAWLYSPFGNNFVKTMLRFGREREELRVVYDQIGTPTYAYDLAKTIFTAIETEEWHPGVYHFTNEGVCSWFDFTIEILRQSRLKCRVVPILSSEYAYRTPRPHYSVLDKAKVKSTFGIEIPYWTDSLAHCLKRM